MAPLCLEVWAWGAGLESWTLQSSGESTAQGFEIIKSWVSGPTLVQPLGQAMLGPFPHP